mgnify:CR=1 FL=1
MPHQQKQSSSSVLNVRQTVVLGVKALGAEVYWNLLRLLREFEIKQLEKRLAGEYETLGRLHTDNQHEDESAGESEKELCRKQIDFLEKEIAYLRRELANLRESLLRERRERWGLQG